MKVGIDATCCFNQRGYGRFTRELLHALVRRHPAHEYVFLVDQEPSPGLVPSGFEIRNAHPQRLVGESAVAGGRRSVGDMFAFTRVVRSVRPDVFLFPAIYSFFPLPPRTRSVVCMHDTIAEEYPEHVFANRAARWAWTAKVRVALWQATRIMTVSEFSRRSIMRCFGVRPERIDLVTEAPGEWLGGGDRGSVDATLRSLHLADRPYLLFVGGISPHKNLKTLLRAMQQVHGSHDVRLVMVGDAQANGFHHNSPELQALIGEGRMGERCVFTGFVPDAQLADLYRGAVALVFPSLCEGFGLPAIEAMASGTPVLASDNSALPEVVGDAGLYFHPRDEKAMAGQILKFLDEPSLREDLQRKALARAKEFTWERAADLTMESLERAADGRARGRS